MKKIIALAIASAFVAPAVLADATIYGSIRTAVQYDSVKDSKTVANNINRFRLVDEGSRLGFKGTDKLDSGLTVAWQSESRIRVGSSKVDGTNDTTWGNRNTFVSLAGDFGKVTAGSTDDIIDAARGDFMGGIDNFEDTSGGVGEWGRRQQARPKNVMFYESPSFSGVRFKAQYDFGQKTAAANAQGYAGSLFYQSNLVDVGVAYKQTNDSISADAQKLSAKDDYLKAFLVGANVTPMPGLDIAAGWTRTKIKSGAADDRQDAFGLGGNYASGKYVFSLGYGQLNNSEKVSDSKQWTINSGMRYALSKQTSFLAGVKYVKSGLKTGTGLTGSYAGNGIGFADTGVNSKLTSVAVGLRTDF